MIDKKDLFKKENINLLCPYSFEFLNHLIGQLGYNQESYDDLNVKQNVLNTLNYIFDLEILEVYDWINNPQLKNQDMSYKEIVSAIDDLWVKGIEYPDFYGIVLFGPKGWYVKKLEKMGMTHTTDWQNFIEDKIGDLEKWIEKNKPKHG